MKRSRSRIRVAAVLASILTFAALDAAWAEPEPSDAGAQRAKESGRTDRERFLVIENGCALLGSNGEEIERLDPFTNEGGAISPDGRWVAYSASRPGPMPGDPGHFEGTLVIQSANRPEERTTVPKVWAGSESRVMPIWSSDSKRLLICERGSGVDRTNRSTLRLFDLSARRLSPVNLPDRWWPNDWSADGKRVLTSVANRNTLRIAWVNIDGTGEPEFVTSEEDFTYGARLSPDNRRILCMMVPKALQGERSQPRLHMIDLATKTRTMVDRPGETQSHCWSSDGSKIAYTWQGPLLQPKEHLERRTYLITCDPDGTNRRTVTSRTHVVDEKDTRKDGFICFFRVLGWWR